jgi:large subunit ribosomal protein L5
MYEFLDRLVNIVLPRVRDFRGISRTAFDGQGNYSLSLTEQLVFPELNPDKYVKPQGMNITITTSAKNDEQGLALLTAFGMPFKAPKEKSKSA